jgi:hypothetical protein
MLKVKFYDDSKEETTFEVVTSSQLASTVPERWKERYCKSGDLGWFRADPSTRSYEDTFKLLDKAIKTPDKMEEIIGNITWTTKSCDACGSAERITIKISREHCDPKFICCQCVGILSQIIKLHQSNVGDCEC